MAMRNADCGNKKALFHMTLGWAGVAVSAHGISKIVLPKKSKRVVELELMSSERISSAFGVRSSESSPSAERLLSQAIRLLRKYFSGEQVSFDFPLDLEGYTPFQRAVWQAVAAIPYGETRSYAWIAKRIRKPLAARAVGQAMGANPVPIIIP